MIQLKLDELIRTNTEARNSLLGLDKLSDRDMGRIQERFAALAKLGAIPEELADALEDLGDAEDGVRESRRKLVRVADIAQNVTTSSPG